MFNIDRLSLQCVVEGCLSIIEPLTKYACGSLFVRVVFILFVVVVAISCSCVVGIIA